MNPEPDAAAAVEAPALQASPNFGTRLGANALWLLGGRVANHLILVVVSVVIARWMGDAVLGQYALASSLLFLFNGISTLGTDTLLVREIAARRNFSIFMPALLIQLLLSFVILIFVFAFDAPFQAQNAEGTLALKIYAVSLVPLAFINVFGAALRGKEDMGAYSLISIVNALLQLIAVVALARQQAGIVALVTVLVGMNLLGALAAGGVAFARLPQLRSVWRAKGDSIRSILRAGAAIALFGILATLYQRTSLYFVGGMQDAAATGWFAAAARIVEAPKFLHVAVLSALLPSMSLTLSTPSEKNTAASQAYSKSLTGLLMFSALSSALIYALAETLSRILFGEAFDPGIPSLRILAWTLVPFAVSQFFAVRLLAGKRERQVIYALAIAIGVLSILCYFSIPILGLAGAAWSVLASEVLLALVLVGFSFHSD